jgi:molybdopterin/thiamine biosynthesis adenylyltransferase/rhodanese-related sulfurtransferase
LLPMSPGFERYSCQMALPGFGIAAQQLLQRAKVLIVGAGGLGCPAAQYLAASGIGTLGIADHDMVSVSNLHRQVLFTPNDAGLKKVGVAVVRLQAQNPEIKVIGHDIKVASDNVVQLISQYDIVVDCTDNFETRYLLNDACVLTGKPLVYGAIYQYEGQVALWNIKNADGSFSSNYRDLYPQVNATLIPNCADGGVIPTLAGIIGCMQANEVLKYITQTGELLSGKVLIFDAQTLQTRIIRLGKATKTNITQLTTTAVIPTMTAAEVKRGLQNGILELIDIRTDQERDEINIGGEHFEADEIEDNMDFILNGKPKVFYCSSGKRSAEVVKMIRQQHPEAKVFSLEGGLGAWFAITN